MASIHKTPHGSYRAVVKRKSIHRTKTFKTEKEANTWATQLEFEIESSYTNSIEKLHKLSLLMIFGKWEKEVLPGRRCEKWERLKLNNIKKFPGFKAKT